MDADLERALADVLARVDAGYSVTSAWLEEHYPRYHRILRETLELTSLLASQSDVPEQIGPYKVERELGAGGMGTVYLGRAGEEIAGLRPGEPVAIKILHPQLSRRRMAQERFRREAELGRRLRHPNVVRVFDIGLTPIGPHRSPYFVMEYVEGRTLPEFRREQGVAPDSLVRHVALQLARALAAIHAEGVIHRDVKPENVIVTAVGEVKLMDFGVAQLVAASFRLSPSGSVVGSMLYAAPEQLAGEPVDGRTDLYALGATLCDLATGRRRGAAGRDEVAGAVSPFLAAVIRTLARERPERRFATARELVTVLEQGERSSWWRKTARR